MAAGQALASAAASIEQAMAFLGTAASSRVAATHISAAAAGTGTPAAAPSGSAPAPQPAAKPTIGDQVLSWVQANLLKK